MGARPIIYLAGPIAGFTKSQASLWRETAALFLGESVHTLSPLRNMDSFRPNEVLSAFTGLDSPFVGDKSLTRRDLNDIRRCDAVLANYLGATEKGIGTALEIGYAFALGKPIIAVIEPGNPNDHMMIRECAGWITADLDEAIDAVLSILV